MSDQKFLKQHQDCLKDFERQLDAYREAIYDLQVLTNYKDIPASALGQAQRDADKAKRALGICLGVLHTSHWPQD